ncbi:MAG TPA: hypothetical protein VM912_03590 [Terriglobales bacterium]|nr:hypothetical protein [Terriglobales bacterium]
MSNRPESEIDSNGRTILSAGHNSALLRARNALIQTAGYQVVTTRESGLLLELVRKKHFDAVVLCSSIPAHLRKNMARELKELKPALPLIVLCSAAEQRQFQSLADETVIAEHGVSQPLLQAISRAAGGPDD